MTDMLRQSAAVNGPLLAIDTSTSSLTVAVLENGKVRGELSTFADRNHSVGLLPNIEELLASLSLKPKDLQAIAVGNGPGSYTGVRIAVTAGKTFAWSIGLPLIAVSSLEAMALGGKRHVLDSSRESNEECNEESKQESNEECNEESRDGAADDGIQDGNTWLKEETRWIDGAVEDGMQDGTTWFIPLVDARRRQAFTAVYESRGKWNSEEAANAQFDLGNHWRVFISDSIKVMEPWLEQIGNLADDAQLRRNVTGKPEWGAPARIVFVGETEGFAAILAKFDEEWVGDVVIVPHMLSAVDTGLLAYPKWAQGELQEVHTFVPNYAQLTEAEVNLSAKLQKGEG